MAQRNPYRRPMRSSCRRTSGYAAATVRLLDAKAEVVMPTTSDIPIKVASLKIVDMGVAS
jgi:hypothetical protein